MRPHPAITLVTLIAASSLVSAQTRRPAPRTAAPATPLKKEAAAITCPATLGVGASTKRTFCDVLIGRDPATGIVITLPPHRGPVTLTFDLHNRHTFSQEQGQDPKAAFVRYTASIGALTADNTLIRRAAVQSEFRTPADFFDRITGGAGASGLKAVAPTGTEPITVSIPETEQKVSILGEKLLVERADRATTVTAMGNPIAIISNVMIEYRPGPPPRTPTSKAPTSKAPASKAPASRR